MRSQPQHRLPKTAIKAWRISGMIWAFILCLITLFLVFLTLQGEGPPWWFNILVGICALVVTIAAATVLPSLRWKRWRYQIDRHEVDLRRGIFVIKRTLIPVKRVQHVDTRQGPILRKYGLSSVAITTAATTHEIPALDDETADEVRNQISNFARLAEEDV
ncbi:PH domain-containing protein [Halalkalibaculum sp. DA3122]|uniref:PH domain-containing protein n=1 Tax=unclassified Halalkalibaculum TaxID=2964617 RepID=UPI0037545E90